MQWFVYVSKKSIRMLHIKDSRVVNIVYSHYEKILN